MAFLGELLAGGIPTAKSNYGDSDSSSQNDGGRELVARFPQGLVTKSLVVRLKGRRSDVCLVGYKVAIAREDPGLKPGDLWGTLPLETQG